MRPAIRVERLAKRYRLGELGQHGTLGDRLAALLRRRRVNGRAAGGQDELWALRDVSFDVQPGEVVGIIGRNGAGKSTLLKILSRITDPTEGAVELRGRVSSLLEVGTGFHPELTGRENVYLNGSILGMRKAEIDRKFDAIVDFAGVERFLDTPVKRYSSGMQVRLAFAVAAHLEPEILIVDEVLAVGDAEFQRKCLGRMGEVAGGGRTVLFVSHNMAAVENLCTSTLLLDGGELAGIGNTSDVIGSYLFSATQLAGELDLQSTRRRSGQEPPLMQRLQIAAARGGATGQVPVGETVTFAVEGDAPRPITGVTLNIRIDSMTGQRVAVCHTAYQHAGPISLAGPFVLKCTMRNVRLMPGLYNLMLILKASDGTVEEAGPVPFEVTVRDVYGTGRALPARTGFYIPEASWEIINGGYSAGFKSHH